MYICCGLRLVVSSGLTPFEKSNKFIDKIRGEAKIAYILKKLGGPEHRG